MCESISFDTPPSSKNLMVMPMSEWRRVAGDICGQYRRSSSFTNSTASGDSSSRASDPDDEPRQSRAKRTHLGEGSRRLANQPKVAPLEQVQRQRVLSLEVLEEDRVGEPGLLGHRANARLAYPIAREELQRRLEQLLFRRRVSRLDVEWQGVHGTKVSNCSPQCQGQLHRVDVARRRRRLRRCRRISPGRSRACSSFVRPGPQPARLTNLCLAQPAKPRRDESVRRASDCLLDPAGLPGLDTYRVPTEGWTYASGSRVANFTTRGSQCSASVPRTSD